jgi:hypothetical protein
MVKQYQIKIGKTVSQNCEKQFQKKVKQFQKKR